MKIKSLEIQVIQHLELLGDTTSALEMKGAGVKRFLKMEFTIVYIKTSEKERKLHDLLNSFGLE